MKSLHLLVAGLTGAIAILLQPFDTCRRAFGQTTEKVKEEEVYLTNVETVDQEREEKAHQIARSTTVFIQNSNDPHNFGSGVIIAKEGNTYAVLTAAHVLETDGPFTVKIKDKFQYPVKNIQKLPNIDLTRFQFESDENFDVAPLGDFEQVREADEVYVAGYPTPGLNIQSPVFFILPGNVTTIFPEVAQDGYGIAYSNFTRSGMSGGPVFNKYGHVIAIHGRKETNQDGSVPSQWVNLGIPIVLYKQSIPIVQQHHHPHRHLWTHFRHRWVSSRFVHLEDSYRVPTYSHQKSDHKMSDSEPKIQDKAAKTVQSRPNSQTGATSAQEILRQAKSRAVGTAQPLVEFNAGSQSPRKILLKAQPKTQDQAFKEKSSKGKPNSGAKPAQEILLQAQPKTKDQVSEGKSSKVKLNSGAQSAQEILRQVRPKIK